MDFEFSPEQIHLRKAVREFAESEIRPHVMEWDEAQIFPLEVVKKLGELGYMGSVFPEELGGAGLSYIDYSIIIEELSRVDGSVGIILAAHTSLCSNHIYLAGTETQKKKYIPKLATGEFIGAWGLTEPSSGSDAGSARMTAAKHKDGWLLNGTKTFCTNGHYADVVVVIAVTDKTAHTHGLSAFIVEKGTKGFKPGKKENKLGLRASDTAELIFEDCLIPADHLLLNALLSDVKLPGSTARSGGPIEANSKETPYSVSDHPCCFAGIAWLFLRSGPSRRQCL